MATARKKTKKRENRAPLSARKLVRRLAAIIHSLQSDEPPDEWDRSRQEWRANATHYAKVFGCSERTILRDIDILRDLGHEIEYDEAERAFYCNNPDSLVLPLPLSALSDDECIALMSCVQLSSAVLDHGTSKTLYGFLKKLEKPLPGGFPYPIANVVSSFSFANSHVTLEHAYTFKRLQRAILDQHCVQCRYRPGNDDECKDYLLEPLHVSCMEGIWYLLARKLSTTRSDSTGDPAPYRLFRLNRFVSVQPHHRSISQPLHPDEIKDGISKYFINEEDRQQEHTVHIRTSHRMVSFIRELKLKGLEFLDPEKNHQDFTFQTYDLQQAEALVLKWVPELEAIAPPDLRIAISESARQLQKMHGG